MHYVEVTTPHPGTREYRNTMIRITDLVVVEDVLRDVTFMNCEVVGPAVLAPLDGTTISGCSFDTEGESQLFWLVPSTRRSVIGAIGLLRVGFYSCRFRRIGLAVPEDRLADFRRGFGFQS